ncbi:MAG: translation initiation factor IF-2 N-terminal domain-containing protein, partial [Alphaproteobacteria bacterium]
MSKRISEVAKEWGVPAKDVLAKLEQLGVTGRRAQSNIADDEIARIRVEMGLVQEPTVSVGGERVVGERLVT